MRGFIIIIMKNKLLLGLILLILIFPFAVFPQIDSQLIGKIEKIENFKSEYVRSRTIYVWLPPDYNKKEKYAVLYMQDGDENLFGTAEKKNEWGVDETITKLVKENKIRKSIVVAIGGFTGKDRHSEYYPQKSLAYLSTEKREKIVKNLLQDNPQADNYLLFMTKELKPFIDKKYSTFKDQQNTFLAGSSMGGLISIYAISEYPDIFGGAVGLSTHFMGATSAGDITDNIVPKSIQDYFSKNIPSPKNHRIYMDYGNKGFPEFFYETFQQKIDEIIKEKGYTGKNWVTRKIEGGEHTVKSWSERIPFLFELLLKK